MKDDYNPYDRRTSVTLQTATGRPQPKGFPRHSWSNAFLGCTVIVSLCSMALEAYIFYRFFRELNLENITARTIPTYLAIYICAFIFSLIVAFTAIARRNTLQVIGLVIFNVAFLAYSAIQIKEIHNVIFGLNSDALKSDVFESDSLLNTAQPGHQQARLDFYHSLLPFLIAIPCVIALAQVVYTISVIKLYGLFGWDNWTKLGADRVVKNYFAAYQFLIVLLCYDWFFFGGFTVQLLILFSDQRKWEFWVTVAALPITVFGLLAARYAVRHELRWLMLLFDLCLVAAMTYFCYELWRIFGSSRREVYENDRITLGIFAGISIILLVTTFVNSILCQTYFGKADLWSRKRAAEDPHDTSLGDYSYNSGGYGGPGYSKRVVLE